MSLAAIDMPSRVLLAHLVTAGKLGNVSVTPLPPWPGYVEREPSAPDNCVTIFDTTAIDMGSDWEDRTFYPGVTLRFRSTTADVGFTKASDLGRYIDEVMFQAVVVTSGATYLIETGSCPGGPVRVGKESPTSQRSIWNLNCTLTLRRIS